MPLVLNPPVTMVRSGSYAKMFVRRLPALKTLMLSVCHPWEAVDQMHVNLNSMTAWESRCNVSMRLCFALYNDEVSWKRYVSLNNSNRNHMNWILYQKIFKSVDSSLCLTGRISWIILRLWCFLCIRDARRRGNKITALTTLLWDI